MKIKAIAFTAFAALLAALPSCKEGQSYSNLLRDEEKATNWYLAQQKVEPQIPEDSVFITGEDAPFYKMDKDGYIYMQVINPGDPDERAEKGDIVYFRYMRRNLKYMYEGISYPAEGNMDNLNSQSVGPTSFIFGDTSTSSSYSWGSGIQTPLKYLGYNCEVNLVLRSYYGFISDQSACIPYLINIKYYKAEY